MDARTLKALKGSIAKWEKVAAGKEGDRASANCPLCQVFNSGPVLCAGCPVAKRTGVPGCLGTPYELWADLNGDVHVWHDVERGWMAATQTARDLAQDEVDFLKSLLPVEGR